MVTGHLLSPLTTTTSLQALLTSQLLSQVQDTWTPSMFLPKCIKPVFLFPPENDAKQQSYHCGPGGRRTNGKLYRHISYLY